MRTLVVVCPGFTVDGSDPDRDARAFEPVVAAVESFTPRVEVLRAGVCAFATRGPSRYFGGDEALAHRVAQRVDEVLGTGAQPCRVGVADGRFAAERAADAGAVVPPGNSAAFLAPLPVCTLGTSDLPDILRRLGIHTLGDLAALPAPAVLGRFGPDGISAHRLARGLDERPLAARTPPPDLTVAAELDPPVDHPEALAFVAKSLADQLDELLVGQGLMATRVSIQFETEHGESLSRLWRHDGGLTAAALAQRVRWQLDGWLAHSGPSGREREAQCQSGREREAQGPTSGVTLLRLVPDEVGPAKGRQGGFWGGQSDGDERAARVLARVQGMLSPEAVVTAVEAGGREPGDRVCRFPWGDTPPASDSKKAPWPGRIPTPSPATVYADRLPAEVVERGGAVVNVTGRGHATSAPARLSIAGSHWTEIAAWAGPWPLDERWWDAAVHRRQARWQVVTTDGAAHLLVVEHGRWSVEATYD
ncbi:MAG TPA: DNA polymerase Y family protein [Acidimicrobiales bacterium]|nr:DNA polymerase Y family protein [Acidimicrobiales bacterium]